MFLITELNNPSMQTTLEESNGVKSRYIIGPIAVAETVNRNNRVYPKTVLESAFATYIDDKLKTKTSYGELGHPAGPKINEDRISHLIEDLRWEGNNVIGRAKILNTPMGQIAEGLIAGGGQIGASTRGLGSVKENSKGINEVQADYKIACGYDLVTDPSAVQAWQTGIMEGVNWVYDAATGDWRKEQIENLKNEMKKLSSRDLNEKALSAFSKYLKIIQE